MACSFIASHFLLQKISKKGGLPMTNTITKKIRTTKYIVGIYFCETAKESVSDKILRLIKNDIANQKIQK